jgi:hypothetical protein
LALASLAWFARLGPFAFGARLSIFVLEVFVIVEAFCKGLVGPFARI